MRTVQDFIVFSSLNEAEDAPKNGCIIVLGTQQHLNEFADHLETHTLLSVDSVRRLDSFYFTVGTFSLRCFGSSSQGRDGKYRLSYHLRTGRYCRDLFVF